MYKLTIEFQTKEELKEYLMGTTDAVTVESHEDVPATPAKKAPAKKAAARVEEVATPSVEQPKSEPARKAAPEVKAPAFDRGEHIEKAKSLVASLKDSGMEGPSMMDLAQKVYAQVGITAGVKVGEMTDDQLKAFLPAFSARVNEELKMKEANGAGHSFI